MLITAVQASCLKAAANLTTQLATSWYSDAAPEAIDKQRILEFAFYGFVGAVINYEFQHFLERKFPTRTHTSARRPAASPGSLEKGSSDAGGSGGGGVGGGGGPEKPAIAEGGGGSGEYAINYRNVAAKLLLDQTLGLTFFISLFLVITNVLRLPTLALTADLVRRKIGGLVRAGWTIWPVVGLINFIWVPVRSRVAVSACISFGWTIFLSVIAARHVDEHKSLGLSGGAGTAGSGPGHS